MADWRGELARWLAPFVERFGHKARRRMCPLYVAGLIGPGIARASARWPSGCRVAITAGVRHQRL